MADQMQSWRMMRQGEPLELVSEPIPGPGANEVVLEVRACGLCHTDWGYLYGGVRPNAPLPLTLGHEIVGVAIAAGPGAEEMLGRRFLVPAVLPCGNCDLCARGRGNVCRSQKMPGNDFHGGFASHFVAPARYLCEIPEAFAEIENLSVVADAVGTSYQAVVRADAREGDLVIVVGVGGVGIFACQTAKILGAKVIGIDVDPARLEAVAPHVDLALNARELDAKAIRGEVKAFEKQHGLPRYGRKIIECSGSGAGQETSYALLNHDAQLALVGFTLEKVSVRLSNLMAFDATAFGNWGCLPEHFAPILDHLAAGRFVLEPFVERHPMSRLNDVLRAEHHARRPVMIPDFRS